ncbi:MAG: hypothetical protein QM503_12085 [Bacteroidota bacterium]
MKKLTTLFVLLVFILAGANAQKLSKIAPKIIVIGIGEKNLSFDESQYPDLEVYYTPTLIVNDFGFNLEERTNENIKYATIPFYRSKKMVGELYSGTPELIIDADSDRSITSTYILFDKSGLCYTIGHDVTLNSNSKTANKKTFGDNLTAVVKKGKITKPAKKPYGFGKKQTIIGHELGDFPIQSIDGKTLELNTLLGEEPVLVLFFYLDPELDASAEVLTDEEAKNLSNKEITYYEFYREAAYDATKIFQTTEKQFFDVKYKKYDKY